MKLSKTYIVLLMFVSPLKCKFNSKNQFQFNQNLYLLYYKYIKNDGLRTKIIPLKINHSNSHKNQRKTCVFLPNWNFDFKNIYRFIEWSKTKAKVVVKLHHLQHQHLCFKIDSKMEWNGHSCLCFSRSIITHLNKIKYDKFPL